MTKFNTFELQPRATNKYGRHCFQSGEENNNYQHGHCGRVKSRTWKCWSWMKNRLKNGGYYKGVHLEPDWLNFPTFLSDVGEAPSESHTLGRIDNSKGYERGNVVWETMAQQSRNKTSNIWLEGQVLKDWTNERGFNYKTVWRWVKEGKSLEYMKARGKELWDD